MNKNIKRFYIIIILTSIFSLPISSKTIIWDLGNTLFRVSKFGMAKHIGIGNFIKYSIFDWQSPKELPNLIFNILDMANPDKALKDRRYLSPEGEILPDIFCEWLKGKKKSHEVRATANNIIQHLDSYDYFISDTQKKLIEKSINSMFNPEILAKNFKPIKRAVKLLKKCHQKGHQMIILSNFDSETFEHLYNSPKAQKVFQYFEPENIVISGDIGLLKPNPKIYKHVLKKYNLNASECIFIDDQIENVIAAENLGITAYHIADKNYDNLKRLLDDLEYNSLD